MADKKEEQLAEIAKEIKLLRGSIDRLAELMQMSYVYLQHPAWRTDPTPRTPPSEAPDHSPYQKAPWWMNPEIPPMELTCKHEGGSSCTI